MSLLNYIKKSFINFQWSEDKKDTFSFVVENLKLNFFFMYNHVFKVLGKTVKF